MTLWHQYWAWVGGNVGAMPLQALITFAAGWPLRHHAARLLGGKAAADAAAARRIAADLHQKLTGEAHPDAPADTEMRRG